MSEGADWISNVFFCKEIMQHLVNKLSLADIMRFSATCSTLRRKWCGTAEITKDWIDLLDMRSRIFKEFGIKYNKPTDKRKGVNPFEYLIRAARLASVVPDSASARVRCFGGCGKVVDGRRLVNRKWFKYNCCIECFKKRFVHKYVFIDEMCRRSPDVFDDIKKKTQVPQCVAKLWRMFCYKQKTKIASEDIKCVTNNFWPRLFVYPRDKFISVYIAFVESFYELPQVNHCLKSFRRVRPNISIPLDYNLTSN